MHLKIILYVSCLAVFWSNLNAKAVTIKNCSEHGAADIAAAYEIITNELEFYLSSWDWLNSDPVNAKDKDKVRNNLDKYKERVRKKWPNVTFKCKDNKKRCYEVNYFEGVNVGGWVSDGNEMKICYYKISRGGKKMCDLVSTIMHEMAHIAGVPKGDNHNSDPDKETDAVYLIGRHAKTQCHEQRRLRRISNSELRGGPVSNLDIGDSCSFNSQCKSDKCGGPDGGKICLCKNDAQCDSGDCKKILVSTPVGNKRLKQCLSPCEQALERRVAWNYQGDKKWNKHNTEWLCGSTTSDAPARCFERAMHGGLDWGGGTQWDWENAVKLCSRTQDADRTIACFRENIANGLDWPQAIENCNYPY